MNGAENYIEHIRSGAFRRMSVFFMLYTLTAVLCCGIAHTVFLGWHTDISFRITSPAGSPLISATLAQAGTLLFLLIRWAGTFTAFSRMISLLTTGLCGCSVGCASALLSRGLLCGITPERLHACFVSLLILPVLCALSDLYADCLLTLTGLGERRIRFSLIREYTAIFLLLSGGLLLTGILTSVFLS